MHYGDQTGDSLEREVNIYNKRMGDTETNRLQYKMPLSSRYASKEMKHIFSEKEGIFTTWHELSDASSKGLKRTWS